jgi:hypothetical protein
LLSAERFSIENRPKADELVCILALLGSLLHEAAPRRPRETASL